MLDDAVGSVVFVDDGGGGVDGMFTTTDLTARLPFDGASEL